MLTRSKLQADICPHCQQVIAPTGLRCEAQPAHSPFGGSCAGRVLNCPASVGLVEKVPAYLRKVSAYVARGVALHTAMALLIDNARSLEGLVGEIISGYTITRDDVENADGRELSSYWPDVRGSLLSIVTKRELPTISSERSNPHGSLIQTIAT